jgi:hypothetical protein
MSTAVADEGTHVASLAVVRQFDPQLRRLLWADVAARWAEGLPRELVIVYCIAELNGWGWQTAPAAAFYTGVLLNVQAAVSMASYLIFSGPASKPGLAKKPCIGATFVFFALFPLALLLAPFGWLGLVAAFVIRGLWELGEPARKAMITELVPLAIRTQAIGIYWGVRSLCVCLAPLVGSLLWVVGNSVRPGFGAHLVFLTAFLIGAFGAALFAARFGSGVGEIAP